MAIVAEAILDFPLGDRSNIPWDTPLALTEVFPGAAVDS
jgi:hypothetical protein